MSSSSSPKRRKQQKPHHEVQMCMASGKICYPRRKAALDVLNRMRGRVTSRRLRTLPTGVYHCPHCSAWHLTSKHA